MNCANRVVFEAENNTLRVVHAPQDRLDTLLNLIHSAQRSIRAFYYMIADDAVGAAVIDALCAAQARGVSVEFAVDYFGSAGADKRLFDTLRKAGVSFFLFSPTWSAQYLIRNHQKFLIVDGTHAIVGGFNLTESYFGMKGDKSWEDIGLVIEGPAVAPLVDYFRRLRAASIGGVTKLRLLSRLVRRWHHEKGKIAWLLGGPSVRLSDWARTLKHDLETARQIDVVAAYFSPGRGLLKRMASVAQRGRARFIFAGRTDNGATIGAARFLYGFLLRRGAAICEYQPRMLHMKLLVIDDIVYIGSSNLDMRSLFLNLEIMVRIQCPALADHMRGVIGQMAAQSEEQTMQLHRQRRTVLNRIRWALSYFLVAVVDYSVTRRLNLGLKN